MAENALVGRSYSWYHYEERSEARGWRQSERDDARQQFWTLKTSLSR